MPFVFSKVIFTFSPVLNLLFLKCFEFLFIGDTGSLWRIEKLRSESMKQHTLVSGFSCAKVTNILVFLPLYAPLLEPDWSIYGTGLIYYEYQVYQRTHSKITG